MSYSHYEYIKERYTAYLEQRRRLDENSISVAAKHDQWTLTVSGGALALSITFIEKVAPSPYPWTIPFITLAWISFAFSLLAGLLAIRYSSQALVRQVEILDEEYSQFQRTTTEEAWTGEPLPEAERIFPIRIKRWSKLSLIALILGIVFLCIFSIVNINTKTKGTNMSEKPTPQRSERVEKSYIPPQNETPPPPPMKTETYIPTKNEIPPPPPPAKK